MDNNLKVSEPPVPLTMIATAPTGAVVTWPRTLLGDLLETVLPALLIAIATVVFLVQPTRVEGSSMEPTLQTGQRLVIEKVTYRFHAPTHGDIAVLKLPGREHTPLIKRVIGTAGDVIAIRNGRVYRNGDVLTEQYLTQITTGDLPSTMVPEGYIFVLGDNRGASNDSRNFGLIPTDHVVGRAVLSYWPPETAGPID